MTDPLLDSRLAGEAEFLAARAAAVGSALANRELRELGLRVRSYSVLSLASEAQPPTQRQLADFLRLDPSQIVALVDELETAGLIRREADPGDRRSRIVVATAEGRRLLARAAKAARVAEDEALAPLTVHERAQLTALLRRIAFPS